MRSLALAAFDPCTCSVVRGSPFDEGPSPCAPGPVLSKTSQSGTGLAREGHWCSSRRVSNRGPNRSYRLSPSDYVEGPMDGSTTLGLARLSAEGRCLSVDGLHAAIVAAAPPGDATDRAAVVPFVAADATVRFVVVRAPRDGVVAMDD